MRKKITYKAYKAHSNIFTMPPLAQMNWDYKNQLLGATNGTFESFYVYDATGNRVRKVVEKGNITEERFYVGDYEVYRKTTNGTLDVERETVHISDDQKRIAMIDNDGTTETIRFQYDNHLGSASLELDQNAAIISYEEYHPFGTTSYRSGRPETEVSLKRYRYVGKERDEETGLYYYGARYYAAWLGRWTAIDPEKEKRSWVNPYNYCQNNPINRIDPKGALDDDPPIQSNNGSKLSENPYWSDSEPEKAYNRKYAGLKFATGEDAKNYEKYKSVVIGEAKLEQTKKEDKISNLNKRINSTDNEEKKERLRSKINELQKTTGEHEGILNELKGIESGGDGKFVYLDLEAVKM